MAEILVLVDHVDGAVKKVTLELLTLARSLGEPSAVFVEMVRTRQSPRWRRTVLQRFTLPTPLIFCCTRLHRRLKFWRSWLPTRHPQPF